MTYVTNQDARNYLGVVSTTEDAQIDEAIEDAQAYIESHTHRKFEAFTDTRYYWPDALDYKRGFGRVLTLDEDNLTVTELLNGDSASTEIVTANYWLLDRNLGPPYHWIKLLTDTGVYWEWDPDEWVAVTGTWGYSATPPDDIRRATLALTAYFYRAKDAQTFDVTAVVESGAMLIPQGIPATVTRILMSYRKMI